MRGQVPPERAAMRSMKQSVGLHTFYPGNLQDF